MQSMRSKLILCCLTFFSSTFLTSTVLANEAESQSTRAPSKDTFIDGRYHDNGDGTITDINNKLTWMRCTLGQQWTGSTCAGEAMKMNWSNAIQAAMNSRYAGHSDWRVPTIDELDTLVLCTAGRKQSARPDGLYVDDTNGKCSGSEDYIPKININAFPGTPTSWFWSSTPYPKDSNISWVVRFNDGSVFVDVHFYNGQVRLVRAAQ